MHAADLAGFDFNKANSAADVGCVYKFASPAARDAFADALGTLWENAAGSGLAAMECVGDYWVWALE